MCGSCRWGGLAESHGHHGRHHQEDQSPGNEKGTVVGAASNMWLLLGVMVLHHCFAGAFELAKGQISAAGVGDHQLFFNSHDVVEDTNANKRFIKERTQEFAFQGCLDKLVVEVSLLQPMNDAAFSSATPLAIINVGAGKATKQLGHLGASSGGLLHCFLMGRVDLPSSFGSAVLMIANDLDTLIVLESVVEHCVEQVVLVNVSGFLI